MQFERHSGPEVVPLWLTDPVKRLVQQQCFQQKLETGLCFVSLPGSGAALFSVDCPEGDPQHASEVIQAARRLNTSPHFLSAMLGTHLHFPVIRGQLYTATWQEIVMVDFVDAPRTHTIHVRVLQS